ncbi:MAG: hypothetical protein LBT79_00280 [Elusimicrobiota bacterium]|jgi:general secretion pathway protein G|nr:hypothetical protein [Elusimicrobiota bacterium]
MKRFGFNKIELIAALIIIVVLSIIIIPRLSAIINSANETAAKQNLNALRSAIALYYSDNGGSYPSADIVAEISGENKYISIIPYIHISQHKKRNQIMIMEGLADKDLDSGGWAYKLDDAADNTGRRKGDLWVNCSHENLRGEIWSSL